MATLQDAMLNTVRGLADQLSEMDKLQATSIAGATAAAYLTYKIIQLFIIWPNTSPLKVLPGPERVDSYCRFYLYLI